MGARKVELALFVIEQTGFNLSQCDGKWLLLRLWGYQRSDELKHAFTSLLVEAVDLARTLRRENHQGVLGGYALEQLIDRWCGDTNWGIKNAIIVLGHVAHSSYCHLLVSHILQAR